MNFKHFDGLGLDESNYTSFVDCNFEWACDNCIENGNAILAKPSLQEGPFDKHLAYTDTKLFCFDCKSNFSFRKEEKQTWYEAYKLPLWASPDRCLDCRKKTNLKKQQNSTVSKILAKKEADINREELKELSSIYTAWENIDKAKYFQSILRKWKEK